ncbi:MAG: ABC transporter permease subunit, partial [Acidobacteriota bacterium]|nr:ABC transporter permease subunit [Acidobacteriota bacterium]
MLIGAFKGANGGWTTSNVSQLVHQPYIQAYRESIEISGVTALLGGAIGLALAYAAIRDGTPRWIRSLLTTFSGVAANFGGIPLAFAFIATIGTIGIATQFMHNQLHLNVWQGADLFTKTGVEIVYLYFQIPLMVLVIAPAIDGLRREWREAASNLGANAWQFWRHIGLPVLMPSV